MGAVNQVYFGTNGIAFDRLAKYTERVSANRINSRLVQIRIRNTQGYIKIQGIQVLARPGTRAINVRV